MATPRKKQLSLVDTKYYHCISRCVRRAYLCGEDNATGKSYEYRRAWVEDKLLELASIFCIDVCAYSVMSNYKHIIYQLNMLQIFSSCNVLRFNRYKQCQSLNYLSCKNSVIHKNLRVLKLIFKKYMPLTLSERH